MDRQTALSSGNRFYESGKPCARGHLGPRYAATGHCVQCLKDARTSSQRLRNTGLAAAAEGLALFAYKLHPDDHAAALACCQALDLQRGRLPQVRSALEPVPAAPAYDAAMAREIAVRRAELAGARRPAPEEDSLPEEFRRHGL